jgi:sodium transport system ATP-binding protein
MSEAEKLCDTIAIIHGGRILAGGTLAQLRERAGLQSLEEIFIKAVEEKK